MSETNQTETTSAETSAQIDNSCEAPQLKVLIEQLAHQISAADRKNAEALDEIRRRLESLGNDTRAARRNVPGEFAPAFDRLEEAIALLADKVAHSDRAPEAVAPPASETLNVATESVVPSAADVSFGPDTIAPPALRSAVSEETKPAGSNPTVVDPFDFADSITAGNPDEPWDEGAAEALTRIYENDEDLPEPQSDEAETRIEDAVTFATEGSVSAMQAVAAAPPSAPLDDMDRDWLDERLSQISEQIAQAATSEAVDSSLTDIVARLAELETRLESALASVATREDVEGIVSIERSINELADQVARSNEELGRVALIEREVLSLAQRLSDDRLDSFVAAAPMQFADMPQPEIDLESLAASVATRIATELPQPNDAPASTDPQLVEGMAELKDFVRSELNAQKSQALDGRSSLDAIEQAMIRLLDRMDSIEHAQLALVEQMHTADDAAPSLPQQFASPDLQDAPAPAAPSFARAPVSRPDRQNVDVPRVSAAPAPDDDYVDQGGSEVGQDDMPSAEASDPRLSKREEFIAAARRAAVRASERAQATVAANDEPAEQPEADGQTRADAVTRARMDLINGLAGRPKSNGNGSTGKSNRGGSRMRLWVAGVALVVVALGAGKFLLDSNSGPRKLLSPATEAREKSGQAPSSIENAPTAPAKADQKSDLDVPARQDREAGKTAVATAADQAIESVPAALSDLPAATSGPLTAPEAGNTAATERSKAMIPPATIGPASLRTAAANGDPSAEFEVGARFAEGRGVLQDFKQASSWYTRAAQRGFALAQYRLATLQERGLGVSVDKRLAKHWYQKSADQGTIKAMHNLAVLTAGETNGKPDYTTAAAWFTRAAAHGLADSQFNLAILYQNGLGVPKSLKDSYVWFSLAAKSGDNEALAQQKILAASLSAAEKAAADKTVAAWKPKSTVAAANDPRVAGRIWQQAGARL